MCSSSFMLTVSTEQVLCSQEIYQYFFFKFPCFSTKCSPIFWWQTACSFLKRRRGEGRGGERRRGEGRNVSLSYPEDKLGAIDIYTLNSFLVLAKYLLNKQDNLNQLSICVSILNYSLTLKIIYPMKQSFGLMTPITTCAFTELHHNPFQRQGYFSEQRYFKS